MKRRVAFVAAVALALSVGIPPGAVPEGGDFPLSGLWAAFRQTRALADVPGLLREPSPGGAEDSDHYVSAEQTRANGGAGTVPGRGRGAVDADLPKPPAAKPWTAPRNAPKGENFDEKTSKRLPDKSTANYDEFQNADGSITRRIYNSRINYRAADGTYQPIDTDLTRHGDRLEMGPNSIDVSLGVSGSDDAAAPVASATPTTPAGPSAPPSPSAPPGPGTPPSPSNSPGPSLPATPAAPTTPAPTTAPPSPAAERLTPADDALASVTTASGDTMAYDLAGAAKVPAVVDGSTATYREILPGTDLELSTFSDGLKETIVLKSPAAGNEWLFPLRLAGLTARLQDDGSVAMVDSAGKVALRVPPGFMEDSKVNPESGAPAQSSGVKYELVTADGGPALKVTADAAWLADPARQYPVRIDPSVETTNASGDAYVDNDPSTENQAGDNLPVGTWNGTSISRSFLHFGNFDSDGLKGKQITSAKLRLYHTWSYDCTHHYPVYVRRVDEAWSETPMSKNAGLGAGPSYSGAIGTLDIADNNPACTNTPPDRSKGAWREATLSESTFSAWSLGTKPNFGLALTASEGDKHAFKRFTAKRFRGGEFGPRLEITYEDNQAPQVDEQYPGYGQAVQTLTPELMADAQDPDGFPQPLQYRFIIYGKDGRSEVHASDWIRKSTYVVPSGALKWGESYYWTVVVRDGVVNGALSNESYLTKHLLVTPVPQPAVTASLSQNPERGFDPTVGNYTTSVRDAMVNTVGPALEIQRAYNSIDPRVGQAFGAGWSSVVDARITERGPEAADGKSITAVNTVVVTYPNGREMAFGRNADDTYSSPAGNAATLSKIPRGYRLAQKDGTTYEFARPEASQDQWPVGQYPLSSIEDIAKRTQTFTHTGTRLSEIKSASGRSLFLYWSEPTDDKTHAHVSYVATDPVTPGDWDSVNTWYYEYSGNALTKVCPPTNWGDCHTYQYAPGSLYQSAVINARPYSYWRLTETEGNTAASKMLENAGTDNGTYTDVTRGQPGPLAGSAAPAAGFNGSSSQVSLRAGMVGDAAYQAISMWFKTSGGEGVLYGQSWDPVSVAQTTGAYNPTLYIGTNGKLMGGFPMAPVPGNPIGSLIAYGSGRCVAVPGNQTTDIFPLVLDTCTGTAGQQWSWTTKGQLRVTVNDAVKCLDTRGGGLGKGVGVVTTTCDNDSPTQQWDVQAGGHIVNNGSNLCLDTTGTALAFLEVQACLKSRRTDQSFMFRNHTALQSAVNVADGEWHHVVLSASGNKQQMYIDNRKSAELSGTVQDMRAAYSYLGFGYLGGGYPNQSHVNTVSNLGFRDYFAGSIGEVALFDTPVTEQMVRDIYAAREPRRLLTTVVRPSGNASVVVAYDQVSGRVSQVTDGNGSVWRPQEPKSINSSKVHESAVLGAAPSNYWRLAEPGGEVPVDQVRLSVNDINGDAAYNKVKLGGVPGPFGDAGTAASFKAAEGSYAVLPAGAFPAGSGSVSMWFNTASANGVLLGEDTEDGVNPGRHAMPTMWLYGGVLRAVSPSATPTAPLTDGAGKCLEVTNAATADGTPIARRTCNATAQQNWSITNPNDQGYSTIRAFDKCMTANAQENAVQLRTCSQLNAQAWKQYDGMLYNLATGQCLGTNRILSMEGLPASLVPCTSGGLEAAIAQRKWTFGLSGGKNVADNKWHHAVLTTNGTTQTLYLDGVRVQCAGGTALKPLATQPHFYLGAAETSSNWSIMAAGVNFYTGNLAEVAFYRSEVPDAQVSQQYKTRLIVNNGIQNRSGPAAEYAVVGPRDPSTDRDTVTKDVHDLTYGRKIAEIAEVGGIERTTRYGYNAKGYLRTLTDPNGNMTINEYDDRGNMVSTTTCQDLSENNCTTSYLTYSPEDRLKEQRGPGSTANNDNRYLTTYAYDDIGNRISMVDPVGRKTYIQYTDDKTNAVGGGVPPRGLPSRITKPGGGVQTIRYYATGDIAEVTDPAGLVTRYEYDGLGRTTKQIEMADGVAGATTTFEHDRLDRVITTTEPAVTNQVTGAVHTAVTSTSYNVDGLKVAETVWDATGGDAPRTVSYAYDDHGRLTTETDAQGNKLTYGYDGYGRVNRQTHADGSTESTVFDALGNELRTVVEKFTGHPDEPIPAKDLKVRSMEYDPAGRLSSMTDAEGFKTTYTYTDNGLLRTVTRHEFRDGLPADTPQGNRTYVLEDNTYDAAGNLVRQVTNNGLTRTDRAYDRAGRNLSATLDPDGLKRTTAYEYSAEDEVVSTILSQGDSRLSQSETMYDRMGRAMAQTTLIPNLLSPVGRWDMDSNTATATDDTGANNVGTLTGNVTWSTERGGAAAFNGTAGGIVSGFPMVDSSRPYSLAAWVKLDSKGADRVVAAMPGDFGNSAIRLLYDKDTDKWQAALGVRDPDGTQSWVDTYSSAGAAVTGTWTHLAVTVDPENKKIKLYVGGALQGQTTTTKDLNNRATGMQVGSDNNTNPFSGLIDGVQAYQAALSDADVADIVNGQRPASGSYVLRTSHWLTSDGSVRWVVDPRSYATSITNDELGRPARTRAPAVNTVVGEQNPVSAVPETRVGYNTFGEPTEQQDANGNVTITRYDAVGRPVETQLPKYTPPGSTTALEPRTTNTYNEVGQVVSTTDPSGATTSFRYDQLGRTVRVTAADSGVSRYRYDLNGELLSQTDPTGATVETELDYLGRTTTSAQAVRQTSELNKTRYEYGTGPWPSTVTSPSGVSTTFGYNTAGEQVTVTNGINQTTTTQYDGLGRPVRVTAPDSTYTTTTHDGFGRPNRVKAYSAAGELLRTEEQWYDRAGNVTSTVDARGTTKTFSYDALGQLTRQSEPISGSDSIVSTFGYDLAGNQTRFTDGRGNRFVTTYNSWNLPASQIEPATTARPEPAGRTFTMSYDAGGRMTRLDSPGGVAVSSEYDQMGRLRRSVGSGAQATTVDREFGYDLVGRMTSFTGSAGSTAVAYDDRGLPTAINGVSGASSYAYNRDGALTTRTDAAGTTSYTYDKVGRLAGLANQTAGLSLTYGYNSMSQVSSITYGGGNTRSFGYNALHQLVSDELKTGAQARIAKIEYGWDVNDNLTSKKTIGFNGASSNSYSYDLANRLVGWDNGTTPVVYAYDKSGNRVQAGTKTFTYDERNQLLSSSDGTTYEYTARGTLAASTTNGERVETATDAFNQVVSQGARGGAVSRYSYDGLGRLIQPNLTYTGLSNTVASDGTATYVRDTSDGLVGVGSSGGSRYALTDIHSDVVGEVAGTAAALAGSVTYDPWGKILASGGMAGKLGYQSEWTDQGTGRVNMWSRWYDPETGAFDTRDTASNKPSPSSGAANRFAYAEGNPLTNTDTSGNGVDGKCGEYDYDCAMKVYQGQLAQYNTDLAANERDVKFYGGEIAKQEAEYTRAERESNTSLLDILIQVGVGMLLDMIGYNSLVGCLGGSVWDCVDLASNFLGPIKALKMAKSLFRAADRAFSGYRMWQRLVEGARTVMRRAQDLVNQARKFLNDVMKKKPKKPKPPKKKAKPPTRKKPKPKPEPKPKPKPSKPAAPAKPRSAPKKADKPKDTKPAKEQPQKDRADRDQDRDRARDEEPDQPQTCPPKHSFDPATRVLMADGSTRPISEVNIDDTVATTDPATGEHSAQKVTVLHANRDRELTDVTVSSAPAADPAGDRVTGEGKGERSTRGPTEVVLHTTAHHPFWDAATGSWVDAADLIPGTSTLVGPDGQRQYVTDVDNYTGAKVMRDLTVATTHTYYVIAGNDPVLVHNNDEACPLPQRGTDGRFEADPNRRQPGELDSDGMLRGTNEPGYVTSRPSLRTSVVKRVWAAAKKGPNGGRACRRGGPNCVGEVMVPPGSSKPRDWDYGHDRGDAWSNTQFPPNVTRPQVIDRYHVGGGVECIPCNRGAGAD